jgi:cell division protein FtsB
MKSKNLTENIKKKLYRLTGWAIWILIILLAFSLIRNIGTAARIKAEVEAEQARLTKMQEDNAKLQAQIAEAQGQDFIEKQIRDKLGLVKNGETIVVLPDAEVLRKLAPIETSGQEALPDPNWKKWLKLFL